MRLWRYDEVTMGFLEWTTKYRYGWILLLLALFTGGALLILGSLLAGRGTFWRQ